MLKHSFHTIGTKIVEYFSKQETPIMAKISRYVTNLLYKNKMKNTTVCRDLCVLSSAVQILTCFLETKNIGKEALVNILIADLYGLWQN